MVCKLHTILVLSSIFSGWFLIGFSMMGQPGGDMTPGGAGTTSARPCEDGADLRILQVDLSASYGPFVDPMGHPGIPSFFVKSQKKKPLRS